MKLSEYEFKNLPEELTEFKDDVAQIVNYGKYSSGVIDSPPTWLGQQGESAFYNKGVDTGWYYKLGDNWQNVGFGSSTITAWIVFSGTGSLAILGSEGVTSLTIYGEGDFGITWANSFSTVNYSVNGASSHAYSNNFMHVSLVNTANNPSVSMARVSTRIVGNMVHLSPPWCSIFVSGI